MNVNLFPIENLPPAHLGLWAEWQRADPDLHSPFFRPEYARHVGAVCPGIEVAVIEEAGSPAGFFAFHRSRNKFGAPVGGQLCDFQGVVARPGFVWDPKALLRGCRLRAWHFHHLIASQEPFRPYHYSDSPSFFMDLSGGYEGYCAERLRAGSENVRKTMQKLRKLEREKGPLRFVSHKIDRQAFEILVQWKTEHYRRINAVNYLQAESTRQFLWGLLELGDECFCGMLSAVYCGDRLAAVHLGLRSCEVLHSWFPTYDPELAPYSPGAILFLLLAKELPSLGIQRIDLGRGDKRFKTSLGAGGLAVALGSVDVSPLSRVLRRGTFRSVRWLRSSRWGEPAKNIANRLPFLRRWVTFHE